MCIRDRLIAQLAKPGTPVLKCYNKADLVYSEDIPKGKDIVAISAKRGKNMDGLLKAIEETLGHSRHHVILRFPYDKDVYKRQVEESHLHYIIRDHDWAKFTEKKAMMEAAADFLNAKYGKGTVQLTIRDSYYNMRSRIEPVMFIVERAKNAMAAVGMNPKEVPIRGGTDGARLSFLGLPCPNPVSYTHLDVYKRQA